VQRKNRPNQGRNQSNVHEDEFTKIEKIKEKMPPRPRELAAARAARALPRRPARYGFKYKARYGTFIAPTLNSLSWAKDIVQHFYRITTASITASTTCSTPTRDSALHGLRSFKSRLCSMEESMEEMSTRCPGRRAPGRPCTGTIRPRPYTAHDTHVMSKQTSCSDSTRLMVT
jgi:hypothetical protein